MSETNNSKAESSSQQLNKVMKGLGELATGLANVDPVATGMKRRESLGTGISDGFGQWSEKFGYIEGCTLSNEFARGVGQVAFKTKTPDGVVRTIGIAKTPNAWNPSVGGKQIEGAGVPSDLLMVVATTNSGGDSEHSFRYLDEADVAEVRVVNGETVQMGANEQRGRQISLDGQVTEVAGYIA